MPIPTVPSLATRPIKEWPQARSLSLALTGGCAPPVPCVFFHLLSVSETSQRAADQVLEISDFQHRWRRGANMRLSKETEIFDFRRFRWTLR